MEEGHLIDLDLARDATGCVTTDLNQFMDKVMDECFHIVAHH